MVNGESPVTGHSFTASSSDFFSVGAGAAGFGFCAAGFGFGKYSGAL
jgi:hypothetical protein